MNSKTLTSLTLLAALCLPATLALAQQEIQPVPAALPEQSVPVSEAEELNPPPQLDAVPAVSPASAAETKPPCAAKKSS